jgi:hypothetical protein
MNCRASRPGLNFTEVLTAYIPTFSGTPERVTTRAISVISTF